MEHNDEFFTKLEMPLAEKDEALFKEWAVWCEHSNCRYYIAGKVVNDKVIYYTAEHTDEEQADLLAVELGSGPGIKLEKEPMPEVIEEITEKVPAVLEGFRAKFEESES